MSTLLTISNANTQYLATTSCPQCGKEAQQDAAQYKEMRALVRVQCSCGTFFHTIVDAKRAAKKPLEQANENVTANAATVPDTPQEVRVDAANQVHFQCPNCQEGKKIDVPEMKAQRTLAKVRCHCHAVVHLLIKSKDNGSA